MDKTDQKPGFGVFDWVKMYSYMALMSGVDIAIQTQLSQQWQLENVISMPAVEQTQGTEPMPIQIGNQTTIKSLSSFGTTAKQLYYAAFGRLIFLLLTFVLCQQKLIPKMIQPSIGYMIGFIVYAFCIHVMVRFLMDSELPVSVFNLPYMFLALFNISFNIVVCLLARKAVFGSGAIEKTEKSDEEEEGVEKKDEKQREKATDTDGGDDETEHAKQDKKERKIVRIKEKNAEKEDEVMRDKQGEEEVEGDLECKVETEEGVKNDDKEDNEYDEDEDEEGERDFENAERKIPLYKMLLKLAKWYTPQLRWILLGYACLAFKMTCKYNIELFPIRCIFQDSQVLCN